MTEQEREAPIHRILVALDASVHSLAALEAASALAETLKAELVGIFVEDVNLLHLAGLPFACEIRYVPVMARPLNSAGMERAWRMQAERMRQAMAGVAGRHRLQWSFRVVRGQVTSELLTAAREADVLALGRASGGMARHIRLGATAREIITQGSRPLLLLQHGHAICHPVQLIYDGSAASRRALATAAQVARATGGLLSVMIVVESGADVQGRQEEAEMTLQIQGVLAQYHQLVNPAAEELAKALNLAGGGTLIIGADNPLLQGEGLSTLLEAVECSVLLIR